jgi:RNA polymerase sigma-32 factor
MTPGETIPAATRSPPSGRDPSALRSARRDAWAEAGRGEEARMSDFGAVNRQVVNAAKAAPYLSRAQEQILATRWRDEHDEEALHTLARAHIRLVMAIASRFRRYGVPLSDMIQEGHIGLLEAAARFEPERDVRFSTYAAWWIRAAIQDFVLRNWSIVRGGTSSAQKSLFFNLRRLRAQLAGATSSANDLHERIATALGVARGDVEVMDARLSGFDISLNAVLGARDDTERGTDRQDYLVDEAPLPDVIAEDAIDTGRRADWLKRALDMLTERERLIIEVRRLGEDDFVTLEMVGQRLGISKERVRQIENRAIGKLRKALSADHAGAYLSFA